MPALSGPGGVQGSREQSDSGPVVAHAKRLGQRQRLFVIVLCLGEIRSLIVHGQRPEEAQRPGLITALLALLSQLKSTPGKPDGLFHTAVEQMISLTQVSTSDERGVGRSAVCCN